MGALSPTCEFDILVACARSAEIAACAHYAAPRGSKDTGHSFTTQRIYRRQGSSRGTKRPLTCWLSRSGFLKLAHDADRRLWSSRHDLPNLWKLGEKGLELLRGIRCQIVIGMELSKIIVSYLNMCSSRMIYRYENWLQTMERSDAFVPPMTSWENLADLTPWAGKKEVQSISSFMSKVLAFAVSCHGKSMGENLRTV